MKRSLLALLSVIIVSSAFAALPKKSTPKKGGSSRDIKVVREYIKKRVGEDTIKQIQAKEGGKKFLETFFADQEWMEEFAGSGPVWIKDRSNDFEGDMGAALKALDLLYWNDKPIDKDGTLFMTTRIGRNIATSFALNHGHAVFVNNNGVAYKELTADDRRREVKDASAWDQEKLVLHMDAYRRWYIDGTLDDHCEDYDTREWREVTNFGQNAELTIDDLEWIHNIANVNTGNAGHVCHPHIAYRLWNCFGASVHGSMYYQPWKHRWNEQELRHRVGCVCGGISKFGSGQAAAHGIKAYTAGQPGHCAFQVWNYVKNRWDVGNYVGPPTGSHFAFGKMNDFEANNEMVLYYQNPARMDAEYLRWQAHLSGKSEDFIKSMAKVRGNWHAAKDWQKKLSKGSNVQEEYKKWYEVVCKAFTESPSSGWDLTNGYLDSLGGNKTGVTDTVKKALSSFREPKTEFTEVYLFDKKVLDEVAKRFNDVELWQVVPEMLDGQVGTANYYNQIVSWASSQLMKTPQDATKFMKLVVANSIKNKQPLDYAGMVKNAGESRDVKSFHQVYKLMDKLPDTIPKNVKLPKVTSANKWPIQDYGGTLLGQEGGLVVKSVAYVTPLAFKYALTPDDIDFGSAFHTEKDVEQWAEVFLKGDTLVTGVTIVNTPGQNAGRQVPLKVEISMNGSDWETVWSTKEVKDEWRVPISKKKARHVRVVRTDKKPEVTDEKEKTKEFFHLKKILVYGEKQY
ncbi:MAG: discoidin domain-containing protein [Kiritimatiellae bacterium]|nr:discoidin domain-containing protein [Kiritimatiellia bacterium]